MSDQPTRTSPPDDQPTTGFPDPGPEATGRTGSLDAAGQSTRPNVSQISAFPPPTVPGYEILGELGRGGMGVVYKARQVRLNRLVAPKVVLAGGHASVPERVRFLQEAEAVAALDHPNVVRVYEVGQHDGLPFMALEFVPGGTLGAFARGPLPAREAAAFVEQVARGVGHAHAHGVVHRDLKPDNILLAPDEAGGPPTPKVADFGLAKKVEAGAGLTSTGAVLGTPAYMAPEQAGGGAKHVGPAADVWALGAVLYRLLTGRPPFAAPTAIEVIRRVLDTHPDPPSRVAPGVPRELELVCLKCLQKAPAARYPTANELATDLRRWLDGEAVQAKLPRGRLYRRVAFVVGLVVLAVAGAWAVYEFGRKSDAPPPGDPTNSPLPAVGEEIDAVAVLPFENVGGKPEDEFLADGIGESISNSLSAVRALKVRPFTSASAFRGEADLRLVGRKLQVQAVVTGRVTRQGDRVRVAVRLVDVRHDSQLWGDSYEPSSANVFPVQQEIVREVARALKQSVAQSSPAARRVPDPVAFDHYLKGRYLFNASSSEAQTRKAIDAYRAAVAKDPEYALPHLALAEAYYWLSGIYAPPPDVIPKAKEAAARAIELDDSLGDAHSLLGLFAAVYDWDWEAAGREFGRARELSPGSPVVHTYYALYLIARGRTDEAMDSLRVARERDPSSSFLSSYPGFFLYLAGRNPEAVSLLRGQVELDQKNPLTRAFLGLALEREGKLDDALKEFDECLALDANNVEGVAQRGHVLAVAGRRAEAEAVLKKILAADRFVSPYNVAILYAGLGDKENALKWLEKAYADHSEWLAIMRGDPRTATLRDHPRFKALLRKIRLAE